MRTRTIGSLEVGVVGLGCNNFGSRVDEAGTARVVDAAIDHGITLLDTADIYGGTRSEEFLGRALGSRRDRVAIATKFAGPVDDDPQRRGGSARWVTRACEDSLRRLGTDRIDLYQYHFPDPNVPVSETLAALDELVRAGKVLHIGSSNFSAAQIAQAESHARKAGTARFVCAQNHYNLLNREVEDEVLPACAEHGQAFLPYFPLASGLLTGKYAAGEPIQAGTRLSTVPEERRARLMSDRAMSLVEELRAFAIARDHTLLELAFSWLVSQDVVTSVIAGATSAEQIAANATAAEWHLSEDDLAEIDRICATQAGE